MRRLVVVFLPLTLLACSNPDMSDLKEYVAEVKARPPGGVSPAPQLVEAETYLYVPGERRDPFRAGADEQAQEEEVVESGLSPDFNRAREELESYSLDSLRMVGTLEQEGEVWGLVKTSEGTIHRVSNGNYMGQNHGRIIEIAEDRIKLVELVKIGNGYQEQEAALGLGEGG